MCRRLRGQSMEPPHPRLRRAYGGQADPLLHKCVEEREKKRGRRRQEESELAPQGPRDRQGGRGECGSQILP